ncbi:MAG: polysaccharide deacetylase family protein [Calditrichaeota bacterium]|nr:polysaccharide deacetylase family protein [Calditrichota bacterium]
MFNLKSVTAEVLLGTPSVESILKKRLLKNGQSIVLNYHRLCKNEDPFFPALPVDIFQKQVEWLAENFQVLPVSELVERSRKGHPLDGTVAITFDDGYRDNYELAFPILKTLNLPATFFVTTHFIEGHIPWFDRVHYAIHKTREAFGHLKLNGKSYDLPLRSIPERLKAISFVKSRLKKIPLPVMQSYIEEIEQRLHVDPIQTDAARFMNWDQLREMASAGMEIGSHSLSHPIFSLLSTAQAQAEIAGSKTYLEEKLRQPIRSFCYPNGKSGDFTETTKKLIKDAGYRSAVTTEAGYFTAETDLYEIPRFYTSIRHPATFSLNLLLGRN